MGQAPATGKLSLRTVPLKTVAVATRVRRPIAERSPATTGLTSFASVHTAATPIVPAPTKRTL